MGMRVELCEVIESWRKGFFGCFFQWMNDWRFCFTGWEGLLQYMVLECRVLFCVWMVGSEGEWR